MRAAAAGAGGGGFQDDAGAAVQGAVNGRGRTAVDGQVVGVEQPAAACAFGCRRADGRSRHVERAARGLDRAAVAAQCPAGSGEGAGHRRRIPADERDRTTVTTAGCRGCCRPSLRHGDRVAGPAAYCYGTAARVAGGIDERAGGQDQIFPGQGYRAAGLAGSLAGSIQGAAVRCRIAFQADNAVHIVDALRPDDAAVVDHGI